MKKKAKLLLLLAFWLIPLMVKADMAAPMTQPYEMVVISEKGIDCADYQGNKVHLNKGDKFKVRFEMGDSYTITINGKNQDFIITSLSGAVLVTNELLPENVTKDDNNGIDIKNVTTNNTAVVYANDGVDIRKGPSKVYEKIGHLDKDTTFKYIYSLHDGSGITHVYVDVNGVKGWIEILEGKVLLETTSKFITSIDLNIDCATVPKNTVLSPKYIADVWSREVLVEYNNCKKMVYYRDSGLAMMSEYNMDAQKELVVYEYAYDGGTKIFTIPAGAKYTVIADASRFDTNSQMNTQYVSFNGKTGWITNTSVYEESHDDGNNTTEPSSIPEETKPGSNVPSDVGNTTGNKTSLDMTLTYVIIGLAIALMAVVVILLVNRNKQKPESVNNDEQDKGITK